MARGVAMICAQHMTAFQQFASFELMLFPAVVAFFVMLVRR